MAVIPERSPEFSRSYSGTAGVTEPSGFLSGRFLFKKNPVFVDTKIFFVYIESLSNYNYKPKRYEYGKFYYSFGKSSVFILRIFMGSLFDFECGVFLEWSYSWI